MRHGSTGRARVEVRKDDAPPQEVLLPAGEPASYNGTDPIASLDDLRTELRRAVSTAHRHGSR